MRQQKWIVRLAGLFIATAACSSTETPKKLTVQGTVSQELYGAEVEAVAVGKDGRTFWAKLDREGDFKLVLPVGQPYKVVLVRAPRTGETPEVVAEVNPRGANGPSAWIEAGEEATVRLGVIMTSEGYQQMTGNSPVNAPKEGSSVVGAALGTALLMPARGGGRGGHHDDDEAR